LEPLVITRHYSLNKVIGRHLIASMRLALGVFCVGTFFSGVTGIRPAVAKDLDMKKVFRCQATDKVGVAACDKARNLILNNCTSCHAFVPIVLQQFDVAGWGGLLSRHRSRVPQLSDAQVAEIKTYLAANFNESMPPPDLPAELLKEWTKY
jgi:uncharacterized membrane protein